VGGGDVQFGDVVEILLNAEVRDRLIRRHRTRIVAVPNEYDFLSWFISRT
jgi:prophage tail gpP-like protein